MKDGWGGTEEGHRHLRMLLWITEQQDSRPNIGAFDDFDDELLDQTAKDGQAMEQLGWVTCDYRMAKGTGSTSSPPPWAGRSGIRSANSDLTGGCGNGLAARRSCHGWTRRTRSAMPVKRLRCNSSSSTAERCTTARCCQTSGSRRVPPDAPRGNGHDAVHGYASAAPDRHPGDWLADRGGDRRLFVRYRAGCRGDVRHRWVSDRINSWAVAAGESQAHTTCAAHRPQVTTAPMPEWTHRGRPAVDPARHGHAHRQPRLPRWAEPRQDRFRPELRLYYTFDPNKNGQLSYPLAATDRAMVRLSG